MMKYTAFLLPILFFISCSPVTNDAHHYDDFPETIHLQSEVVELDTVLFRYPFRIRIQDNRAVVMDLHAPDYYYHFFTFPEFTHLASFGKRGDAPNEMLSAENFRIQGDTVWMLDANKRELVIHYMSGDSTVSDNRIVLEETLLRPLDMVLVSDSLFIIPDYSGEQRFCWVNARGKLLSRFGVIPTQNKEALQSSKPALAQAWRSFIDYNPRKQVLAAVTQLGEVLEIYNLCDSTHTVVKGPFGEPEFQLYDGYAVPSGIMGFSDIQITDNYIYAVFHGRTFRELSMQKEHIDGGQYIYVFTLTGEPVRKYVLDSFVYGICVDEGNAAIWATDVNRDEPVVRFRL